MITNSRIIFITIYFATYYLCKSVDGGRLSEKVKECRDNIYKDYGLDNETMERKFVRDIILKISFKFKLLSNLSTDDAKDYYKEVGRRIIPFETDVPKQYCEKITLGEENRIKNCFECFGTLQRHFLDSDDPLKVLKDAYFRKVQSVFDNVSENDYAKRYFKHMAEHIYHSYTLHTPVKFCEEKIKRAKLANHKKRIVSNSGKEHKSKSTKVNKSLLPSTSGPD